MSQWHYLLFASLLVYFDITSLAERVTYHPEPYDFPIRMNLSGLSITSVVYNPSSKHSAWVRRLLGEEAIFHNRSHGFRSPHALHPREKAERSAIFAKAFRLPAEALVSPCSLEIFGYVPTEVDHPFTHEDQKTRPSVGTATLRFPALQTINAMNEHLPREMTWTCYYRGVYENTHRPAQYYVHQYWPVFLFCPAPQFDHSCLSLLHLYQQQFVKELQAYQNELKREPMQRKNEPHEVGNADELMRTLSPQSKEDSNSGEVRIAIKTFPIPPSSLSHKREGEISAEGEREQEEDEENPFLHNPIVDALDAMERDKVKELEVKEKENMQAARRLTAELNSTSPKTSGAADGVRSLATAKKTNSPKSGGSPYRQYTSISSSLNTEFRELYAASPALYPNSVLAYATALLSSGALSFARLNYPRPLYEYLVSPATLSVVARLQRLAKHALSAQDAAALTAAKETGVELSSLPSYDNFANKNVFHTARVQLPLSLSMSLESTTWNVDFHLDLANSVTKTVDRDLRPRAEEYKEKEEESGKKAEREPRERARTGYTKAVCSVIPYSPADPERAALNGWMIYMFVRYYSRMGFLVMLYDRKGENLAHIEKYRAFENEFGSVLRKNVKDYHVHRRMDSEITEFPAESFLNATGYGRKLLREDEKKDSDPWHLRYYNYTLFQLLRLYTKDIVFDNKDGMLNRAIVKSDFDKRLTLTQCRQSVKQLYGIEEVLVIDFDEFLYCPQASAKPAAQEDFYDSYTQHFKNKGVDQFVIKQRVLISKQDSMKDCLFSEFRRNEAFMDAVRQHANTSESREIDWMKLATGGLVDVEESSATGNLRNDRNGKTIVRYLRPSLFHCLSGYEQSIKMFFDKSVHLTNACPFTSYHHVSFLRQFDCFANTYTTTSKSRRQYSQHGCSVVHITTKTSQYNRTHGFNMQRIRERKRNELFDVLHGPLN